MEQMKVSSIVKTYPNAFVLAEPLKRDSSGRVKLANVCGVRQTKEEAYVMQTVLELVWIHTFIIPTFETTDSALSITLSNEDYKAEPLLSPADYAKMFREYYDL